MSQEAYEMLRQDLIGGHGASTELFRRQRELQSRQDQWRAEREQAQTVGQIVPPLHEDETYATLTAERQSILETLRGKLAQPRLDAAAMMALRSQLTPEEKARLRQDLLGALQACPLEIKAKTAAAMDEVVRKVQAEYESSPELEKVRAKIERLKKQINGLPDE